MFNPSRISATVYTLGSNKRILPHSPRKTSSARILEDVPRDGERLLVRAQHTFITVPLPKPLGKRPLVVEPRELLRAGNESPAVGVATRPSARRCRWSGM